MGKPHLAGQIVVGDKRMYSAAETRALAQSNPEKFVEALTGPGADLTLQNWNMRGLFEALVDVQVKTQMTVPGLLEPRAITTGAFPALTSGLVVKAINAAYEAVPKVGDQLVTDMEDNKKVTQVASVLTLDKTKDEVKETEPFPEISAGEEVAEIRHKKNGRKVSLTAEMIQENDVPLFADLVASLGEIMGDYIEEQTLLRVTDRYGSATSSASEPYVYRPNGTGTALYTTSNSTLTRLGSSGNRQTNKALTDQTDIEAARVLLAAMTNSRGKRIAIPVSQCILLVPDALASTAATYLNSELVPGNVNELNPWGPRGQYRPRLLSTPKLDDIDTSTWYLGQFAKQFLRKWKMRMELVTLSGTTQEYLDRQIAFQARIAWDVEIGARDYVYVIQSLAGTAFPSA